MECEHTNILASLLWGNNIVDALYDTENEKVLVQALRPHAFLLLLILFNRSSELKWLTLIKQLHNEQNI